jgi:hypothetical protein
MYPNMKPSQRVSVIGAIDPQSATTVKTTAWVSMLNWLNIMAVIHTGAISATGTVDAKLQQATDNAGTGAKALNNTSGAAKALVQLTAAANGSQQFLINARPDEFDVNGGFTFVQLSVTPAVAAALISAELYGFDPVYGVATDNDAASVAQVV